MQSLNELLKTVLKVVFNSLLMAFFVGVAITYVQDVRETRNQALTMLHRAELLHREGLDKDFNWPVNRRNDEQVLLDIELANLKPRLPKAHWDCIASRLTKAKLSKTDTVLDREKVLNFVRKDYERVRSAIYGWYNFERWYLPWSPSAPDC